MIVIDSINALRAQLDEQRRSGRRIGLVPTMGYLHAGHVSLVEQARRESDFVVATIFVNPTQFAPGEDLAVYPRDLEGDRGKLVGAGCDLLYLPRQEEMYPDGFATFVIVDEITSRYEGASRPTHFRGVSTIVAKLFNIVQPDVALFGQKDAQQVAVIRRMARDLNFRVRIVVADTVREADGLAMSCTERLSLGRGSYPCSHHLRRTLRGPRRDC